MLTFGSLRRNFGLIVATCAALISVPAHAQTCPFDNGGSTLENDGLVLTRYALGLRGATMVANTSFAAVDAPTIESNIACPSCGLNVTGGGTFTVADATIISRKIAGFSGPALTNGLGLSGPAVTAVNSFLLAGCGAGSNGWVQGGNTFGAPGVIGTNDAQPMTVKSGGATVKVLTATGSGLRIVDVADASSRAVNVINGSSLNSVTSGVIGATISGGGSDEIPAGAPDYPNSVTGNFGTVGGGFSNSAGFTATVAGGDFNLASGIRSTVSGGGDNTANATYATVSGGSGNTASNLRATVVGGTGNQATGSNSTVVGGSTSTANGDYSFVAGSNATASGAGEFVWNSSDGTSFNPALLGFWGGNTANTVNMRAARGFSLTSGGGTQCSLGAGTTGWNCASDRSLKDKIMIVNPRAVLEKVANLPISTWVMTGYEALHMGPMAQDFRAAFGLGRDDKTINTTDAQGVALAAIQGLHQMVKARDAEIAKLKAKYDADIAAIKKKLGM
jgi:trimeric autotransporter adhesin